MREQNIGELFEAREKLYKEIYEEKQKAIKLLTEETKYLCSCGSRGRCDVEEDYSHFHIYFSCKSLLCSKCVPNDFHFRKTRFIMQDALNLVLIAQVYFKVGTTLGYDERYRKIVDRSGKPVNICKYLINKLGLKEL